MKHTRTRKNFIEQPVMVIDQGAGKSGCNVTEDVTPTLACTHGGEPVVYDQTYQDTTGALCASGYDKLGTQEAMNDMYVVGKTIVGDEVTPTLVSRISSAVGNTQDNLNVITYGLDRASFNQGKNAKFDFQVEEEEEALTLVSRGPGAVCETYQDVTETLDCNIAKGTGNQIANNDMLIANSVVRRLTPKECERLQGFPDDWTMIDDWTDTQGKKHKCTDSARYKALGNSICLPYWDWCAERMVEELMMDTNEEPTMASLFDGIGGFPFVYQKHGCRPVWASEIEEFPIAVTKVRFPE